MRDAPWTHTNVHGHITQCTSTEGWAGNKVAMWRTADPPTRVQIPPRPLNKSLGEKNMIHTKHYVEMLLILCIFSGALFLPLHQPLKADPLEGLIINEVMYHPLENENTNEWIELYNPTQDAVDVAGWMIADEKETDIIQADNDHSDGSTILPPKGYALITDKGTTIYETYTITPDAVRLYVDDSTLCGYGLNNQNEKLILFDSAGTIMDAIEWGEDYEDIPGLPATNVAKGNSLARNPDTDTDDSSQDFFECSSPTPGNKNNQGTQNNQTENTQLREDLGCSCVCVLITELYYDTHPNLNAEYVQLTNPTNTTIDVSSWYLTDEPWKEPDDQPKILFPEHTYLPANTSWVITKNATAFLKETTRFPDFEYAVDSHPQVPHLPTYKTIMYSNTGGLVGVFSANHILIDLIIYGTTDHYMSCWEGPSIPSSGQGVILKRNTINGTLVDTNTALDWIHARIYHIGQSEFPLQTIQSTGELRLFVSPDCSYETIIHELRAAHRSIDVNMYEFTNPFLYDELLAALKQNITVRLFMEGSPIGGLDIREKYILSCLASHGAFIHFLVSDHDHQVYARYRFDHAKYLIIDNETVIVESCNWAKTGVPKNPSYGNREWGIVIHDPQVAAQFCQVFQEDFNPLHADSYPFEAMNLMVPSDYSLDYDIPSGSYPASFTAQSILSPSRITPVFSPDTSEKALLTAIESATTTIYIEQLYIYTDWGDTQSPLVNLLINKSQQGVRIKVILDYHPDYEGTTAILNETKNLLESYGIDVKFISSTWSPFVTVHNKGMITDNTTVLISSINWNEQSVRNNREAGILLENTEAATYYATVFLSDWNLQPAHTSDDVWVEYKYLLLIAIVLSITVVLIIRDWRKRTWR
jgi:cardiolipin synthase